MDEQTAYCSDGVTRDIFEMYAAEAKPTEDPDQAIAAVVKGGDDQFILLNLTAQDPAKLHSARDRDLKKPPSPNGAGRNCFQASRARRRKELDGFLEFLG